MFFGFTSLVEGEGIEGARLKIKKDLMPAAMIDLAVWPALNAINFAKVPVEHQLLFVNLLAIFDSSFLIW